MAGYPFDAEANILPWGNTSTNIQFMGYPSGIVEK
jgi:hypothetical protein